MGADQAAKLAYQLILLINNFLHLVNRCKKNTHICHSISRTMYNAVATRPMIM